MMGIEIIVQEEGRTKGDKEKGSSRNGRKRDEHVGLIRVVGRERERERKDNDSDKEWSQHDK